MHVFFWDSDLVSLLALGSAFSFYNTARLAMAEGDPYRMEQQLRRFQAATRDLQPTPLSATFLRFPPLRLEAGSAFSLPDTPWRRPC